MKNLDHHSSKVKLDPKMDSKRVQNILNVSVDKKKKKKKWNKIIEFKELMIVHTVVGLP